MDDCRKSARICVETLKFYGTQIVILHDHQFRENELFTHLFWKEFNQLLCIKQCHYVSHVKSVDPQSSWETDSVTLSGICVFSQEQMNIYVVYSCKYSQIETSKKLQAHHGRYKRQELITQRKKMTFLAQRENILDNKGQKMFANKSRVYKKVLLVSCVWALLVNSK